MLPQPSFLKHEAPATLPSLGTGASWSSAVSFYTKLTLQGRGKGRRGAPAALGMMLGSPGHLSLKEVNVFSI